MEPQNQSIPTPPVPISAFSSLTINPTIDARVEIEAENTPGHGHGNGNGNGHGNGGPAFSASRMVYEHEARSFPTEALTHIFDKQKVLTIRSVVRDLRELADELSALSSYRNKHLIEGARCEVYASPTELASIVKQINCCSCPWCLREEATQASSSQAEPKAVLRKQEIMQYGREIFRREINEPEYAQVVDEICITTEDGGLMLKYGD